MILHGLAYLYKRTKRETGKHNRTKLELLKVGKPVSEKIPRWWENYAPSLNVWCNDTPEQMGTFVPKKVELLIRLFEPFWISGVWGSWGASRAAWDLRQNLYPNWIRYFQIQWDHAKRSSFDSFVLADFCNLFYFSRISEIWTSIFLIRFEWNLL